MRISAYLALPILLALGSTAFGQGMTIQRGIDGPSAVVPFSRGGSAPSLLPPSDTRSQPQQQIPQVPQSQNGMTVGPAPNITQNSPAPRMPSGQLPGTGMTVDRGVPNSGSPAPSMAIPFELSGQPVTPDGVTPCGRESRPPPDCGLDINTVSAEVLRTVPGIEPYMVPHIIAGRPWARVSHLAERGVIHSMSYDMARSWLYVIQASLNYSTRKELVDRLGIDETRAQRIITGRPWTGTDDLTFNGILTATEMERLRGLIRLR